MKIAVYVEGQAELIFVRELLCKWFEYDSKKLEFECYSLRNYDIPGHEVPYSFGNKDSDYHYTIINVGNDTRALSVAISNAQRSIAAGFDRIVVLRDMYCEDYHNLAQKFGRPRTIINSLSEKFIAGAEQTIHNKGLQDLISIRFAIMEVEAWFLGMGWYLNKVDSSLTQTYLKSTFGIDLDADVEDIEYHPAELLKDIYTHVGKGYGKHASEVNSIMSHLDKEDFEMLLDLPKCASFNRFMEVLITD